MNIRIIRMSVALASAAMLLVACAVAEKPVAAPVAPVEPASPAEPAPPASAGLASEGISYANNIEPIMLESCTPCHYPEKGKKELLDTYDATARFIDDIIYRIQLPADSSEFMPYKSKKMPLTQDAIQLFIEWRDAGMPD